jgi:hypothetical protein
MPQNHPEGMLCQLQPVCNRGSHINSYQQCRCYTGHLAMTCRAFASTYLTYVTQLHQHLLQHTHVSVVLVALKIDNGS